MIKIESKKNKFTYNVYHVTKAFYPKEDIVQTVDEKQEPLVKIHLPEGTCFSLAPEECVQTEDVQEEKRDVTKKVYQFLSKQTGQELAWGMLTGVRPTKLVMQKIEQEMTKEEIFGFLKEQYCVGNKKHRLRMRLHAVKRHFLISWTARMAIACMQESHSVQASAPTAHSARHQSLSGKIRSIVTLMR